MTQLLCDVNVWMALVISGHSHGRAVRAWLERVENPASVLFCRTTQQSLLRLLTNRAILGLYARRPLTNREAWETYDALMEDPRIAFQGNEPVEIQSAWRRLTVRASASTKLWTDAYLAAFAIAGGYTLVTTDTGFRQFAGLDLLLIE